MTFKGEAWIPTSFLLQWHITERCDRQCGHCYQELPPKNELDWCQWLEVLTTFKNLLHHWRQTRPTLSAQITVTGGEPFLHPDFPGLLAHLAKDHKHYSFAILCNGGHIDLAMARQLARLHPRFIQVSIDGTPQRHDLMRGAGDFVRVERAVKALKQVGIRTLVAFTAYPGNWQDFPWVARWAWRHGVDRLWADRLLPSAQWQQGVLSQHETINFFTRMDQARHTWWSHWFPRGEIAMHRALQFLVGGGKPYRCMAGEQLLALMPDGTLLPCRRLPVAVGHILHPGGLQQVYEKHDLLKQLRHPATIPDGCQNCFYARLCRGGSRCLAYAISGDPFLRDPGCWLVMS